MATSSKKKVPAKKTPAKKVVAKAPAKKGPTKAVAPKKEVAKAPAKVVAPKKEAVKKVPPKPVFVKPPVPGKKPKSKSKKAGGELDALRARVEEAATQVEILSHKYEDARLGEHVKDFGYEGFQLPGGRGLAVDVEDARLSRKGGKAGGKAGAAGVMIDIGTRSGRTPERLAGAGARRERQISPRIGPARAVEYKQSDAD